MTSVGYSAAKLKQGEISYQIATIRPITCEVIPKIH